MATKSATSSHMMKTTKRGRPFLKDTLDLFATLIVSLDLTTHKQFFRTFPNSFTTEEAATNLSSLKFSQSNRGPDPRDPSRIVTTTTTTTFSMTRDMAKAMCQHFMDARLIENAADRNSNLFKERGIYMLTPKGLHVLERFISKNGMTADHLLKVFSSQPICLKLLHLERRASDDEIIISQSVVTALFRRFAGRAANYLPGTVMKDPAQEYHERSKGISLVDITDRAPQMVGKGALQTFTCCFAAVAALEWLCDFTSIVGRDEAAEMAAHFVRFGLISLVSDKRKGGDSAVIFTVRGSASATAAATTDAKIHRRISMAEKLRSDYKAGEAGATGGAAPKESNTDRLRHILDEPALRSLFREFLRGNFCEENLSFWLDVQDFKRRFNTTSSAIAAPTSRGPGAKATPGQAAMEKHHEALISMAFVIYNTYLAPSSPCELNIDHGLRNELVVYLNEMLVTDGGKQFHGRVEVEHAAAFNATQLQTLIRLYERIQTHVFRLMATDSVPKFIKTSRFMALRNWVEEYEFGDNDGQARPADPATPVAPPGLDDSEEIGRAYMSVSQQAHTGKSDAPTNTRPGLAPTKSIT
ncbi:hypothetical protein FRB99_001125 [Tulasnella sp. 403]|nr:hypothetical protein FRB99_001125 [Tulasnella sp. 403]